MGGGWGGWEAGGGLHRPIELFGVAMSPRSATHRPRHDWRALRDVSPIQGWISDPYLPSSALHGSHCLSRDFTRSEKPALEKQTSQLSLVMQQCMDSAWVWLLAGPIKCNWPSVTLWSVFQYPVTILKYNTVITTSQVSSCSLKSSHFKPYKIQSMLFASEELFHSNTSHLLR